MKAKVKRVQLPKDKRTIVISDIHGNLDLFKNLLLHINYSQKDLLILLGDMIEKGEQSLATLRYIMDLAERNTVHVVSGNCDSIWEDVKYEIDDQGLLRYMLFRKNTIVNEMCEELGIEVSASSGIKAIKKQLIKSYEKELAWLEQLPHILDAENFIFAHAGLESELLEEQNPSRVMKNDAIMETGLCFSKYLVVGHWPVVNYCSEIGCYNPIINQEQKIISIDGGNVIKSEGQLNALMIYDGDIENITYERLDNLPLGRIVEEQEGSQDSIHISWKDNAVELLEQKEEFSLCRHVTSQYQLWIENTKLFSKDNRWYCDDCTDYFLPLSIHDEVRIIQKTGERTLVKRNGTVGWVSNSKLVG